MSYTLGEDKKYNSTRILLRICTVYTAIVKKQQKHDYLDTII